ncbi:MAG: ribosome biogenesis GTPase Der [Bdellovibrio sp.]|nr:MAG: ribosome biogenesis GTPase Der [Bdellovibrio sp.]
MFNTGSSGLPRVAILGRPNVGKSTLFNILTRTRRAMVKDQPGVTRDIRLGEAEWWGTAFQVMDTGGFSLEKEKLSELIRQKVYTVLDEADVLLVVVDAKAGLLPEDREVVQMAQQSQKPFLVVVNKVDQFHKADLLVSEFYEFGLDLFPCSFERFEGVDRVVEALLRILPERPRESESSREKGLRLAILGKPNVGKSSFCNYLLQEQRALVSEKPGTTVDAIEWDFVFQGKPYTVVDTAGLRKQRKRKKTNDGVEILSAFQSEKAIGRSDIVLLMVDAREGPTHQDVSIAEKVLEAHKPLILVANKVDLIKEDRARFRKFFQGKVEQEFHFFKDIAVSFISAHTGKGVTRLFSSIESLWKKLQVRIPTSQLNQFFYETIRQAPAPVYGTRNVKFYYLTQTKQTPPSFIAFANHPQGVTPAYRRFLVNRIKDHWNLQSIPVRIFVMKSGGERL